MDVVALAGAVRTGRTSATAVLERCLAGLARAAALNAVTHVLADRAREEAARVDAVIAAGGDAGPIAGVPYGVKDLFDVAGLPTTAGSALYADAPPAGTDAAAVRRLRAAGGVLVATLNMDAFAYGFATINARYGTTLNPRDRTRLAGGSSGGSAAAVAGGLLPFALGSDTNGSIRVPASLTGLYGLKPTHGALPMAGVFPFAESFDDIGPFAGTVEDMALVWAVLAGEPPRAPEPRAVRFARLGGRFRENADPAQLAAIDAIAPDAPPIVLPDVERARSAAFLITAAEGGALHHAALAQDAMAFDAAVRDRLLAGALIPPALTQAARDFGAGFRADVEALFADHDVLLAPAAPCVAPLVDDPFIHIDGERRPVRAELGIHTQPITLSGLPSLAVPLLRPGLLPLGLQLVGPPGSETMLFDAAAMLEARGVTGAAPAPSPAIGEFAA